MLTLKTKLTLSWLFSKALDLTTVKDEARVEMKADLADGSGVDQAAVLLSDTRTLAASTAENINLATWGGATDSLGQAVSLTKVKQLAIRNKATAADAILEVGGEGSSDAWVSPFEDAFATVKVGPGGILFLSNPSAAGYAVGSTNKLLRIANGSAASASYEIIVVGA